MVVLSAIKITAQTYPDAECGMVFFGQPRESLAEQKGGKWMTARDTLNVLVVFVQFPDDAYDTTYTLWPTKPVSGIYPGPTFLNTYIDSTASQMTTNGNLTHYFREMSVGQFTIIGKTRFVVTPHTYQYYLNNDFKRWNINMEVLQQLDQSLNFAEFDNWKRYGEYDVKKESDGRVDDIFMIYRNVPNMSILYFYGGESSLGYPRTTGGYNEPIEFFVDNGQRKIGGGHPVLYNPATGQRWPGLGTTSVIGGTGDGWHGKIPYRVQIHELAHHWMTDGDYYGHSGRGFWGMLNDWGVRQNSQSICPPNSYERELIGWHAPDSIYQTTTGITLTDYVQTNRSVKIKVPGSNPNEFFRLEYHLKLSQFDNPEVHDPNAKGLYLIHQTGNTNPYSQLKLTPADGRWYWTADTVVHPSYYPNGLAVYKRSQIDRVNGYDDSRSTLFNWIGPPPTPNVPNPSEIHFYRDIVTNQVIEKTIFLGDGTDAFGFEKNNPITAYSNPNTQNDSNQTTWVSIEVVNENVQNGTITLNVYFDSTSAIALQPSKPYLSWYHPGEGPIQLGWIYLGWGADLFDGYPIEPDITWSELQRKIGSGSWTTVYSGPNRVWSDGSVNYNPNGSIPVYFRVKVRDSQNKWSLWSDLFNTKMLKNIPYSEKIKGDYSSNNKPLVYSLDQNYPNPFNPMTTISYQIKEKGLVSLLVFDMLGREVAKLVNETQDEGQYSVVFGANSLPSGVYIYSLRVNDFIQNNKMTLLK